VTKGAIRKSPGICRRHDEALAGSDASDQTGDDTGDDTGILALFFAGNMG
jgi:hypothetical protein